MKKFILAGVLIFASVGYVVFQHAQSAATSNQLSTATTLPITLSTNTSSQTTAPSASPASGSSAPPAPAPTPAPTPKPSGQYTDGTYVGGVADAYYGPIQVEAVISGGKLSDVKVLQYPNDRSTSIYINQQALPMLIQEALQAQSANVNGISGASDTSPAFVQSLGSALAQAKA